MSKSRKRKSDNGDGSEELRKRPPITCVLHVTGIQHGYFTSLSNIKGSATDKLAQLQSIRDKRLIESQNSPNRMEEACNNIPESFWGRFRSNWACRS